MGLFVDLDALVEQQNQGSIRRKWAEYIEQHPDHRLEDREIFEAGFRACIAARSGD